MLKAVAFCHLAKKFGDKYKKLVDTVTKTGIDAAKTASKREVQKSAEAARDLIGNKTADQIISVGKTKKRKKKMKDKNFTFQEKKDSRLLMT